MAIEIKHQILGHIKCTAAGHMISMEAEKELYNSPNKNINTKCIRCGANLCVKVNEDNENQYIVKED